MNPLEAHERSPLPGAISIGEALRDVGVTETSVVRERAGEVSVAVAAALRASVDWLTDGGASLRPPRISNHDGVLELTFDSVMSTALAPAADVLESADANLGPVGDGSGAWLLRAPVMAERELFLLVEQGPLRLALPWHAVVKVRLVATDAIDGFVVGQGWPVIAPFAEPEERLPERPIILVALGLRRAALVADRLVWRMAGAYVEPPGESPAQGLRRTIRTDSGELYWMVEPRWVLRDVEPQALPESAPAPAPAAGPRLAREPIALPARPDPVAATESAAPVTTLSPIALEVEAVAPLELDANALAPVEPEVEASIPIEVDPAPAAPRVLQADCVERLAFDPISVEAHAAREGDSSIAEASIAPSEAAPAAPTQGTPVAQAHATPITPTHAIPITSITPSPRVGRSALVAEDSIIARVFLTRLLEQQGFRVHGVASAVELRGALARGGYTIVFADVELPDGRGMELLRPLAVEAFGAGVPLVALVRDAADSDVARAAGIAHHLRKPYERESLHRLLLRLQPVSGG